ncbi:nuclear transport factor 2 family protein [Nocardia sp. NPDC049149]|uniref:nuclear transport factor 2 family protein n=1 Tax=Nocardia sp. NPDC049149 TaxID=3364315 RepID=UPI00371C7DA7
MTTAPQGRRRVGVRSDRSTAGLIDAADECAVIERFYELLFLHDHEQIQDLVTDDVRIHMPWQLPGLPDRIVGRADLCQSVRWSSDVLWHEGSLSRIRVRPFATPHAWFVDAEGELTALESERNYHAAYVGEVRFRDGRVAEAWSYHNVLHQIIALGADVPGINAPGHGPTVPHTTGKCGEEAVA